MKTQPSGEFVIFPKPSKYDPEKVLKDLKAVCKTVDKLTLSNAPKSQVDWPLVRGKFYDDD